MNRYCNLLLFATFFFSISCNKGLSFPGSRVWSTSWTEKNNMKDHLWIHGGLGYGDQKGQGRGFLSDLWSYDIENNAWSHSPSYLGLNQEPNYVAPFNPGATFASNVWKVDKKLYTFNTNLDNLKASLWKHENNEWKLIHGPHEDSVYGEKGVSNINNTPGDRFLTAFWKGKNNDLYLFGGIKGEDSIFRFDYNHTFNDLWRFNDQTGWTWIHGDNKPNSKGKYGFMNVPSPENVPPARSECSFSSNSTHAIIFGGLSSFSEGRLCLNDLWIFDIGRNAWTWIGGDQLKSFTDSKHPSPRAGSMLWWDNRNNAVYIYGGLSYSDEADLLASHQFGDMWKFDLKTYNWTKILDVQHLGFNESYPGLLSRASTWIDTNGTLWLFGGSINSNFSTSLWSFNPNTTKWSYVTGSKEHDQNSIIVSKRYVNPAIITLAVCLILVLIVLTISLLIVCRTRNRVTNSEVEKLLIQRIRDEEDFDPYTTNGSMNTLITQSNIHFKELKRQEKIKRGKCGPIWFGTYQQLAVAIHEIHDITPNQHERIKNLVSSLSSSTGENVVNVYGSYLNDSTMYIVEEWIGEPLSKCYVGKTTNELFLLLKGIAKGMCYLHSERLNRRILTPNNVLISAHSEPKIRYFSYFDILHSNDKKDSDFLISETVRYMSPESILNQDYSEPSDVWSFGVLVYELFSGRIPFEEVKNPIVLSIKISNEYMTPKLTKDVPEWLSDIVLQCWDPNPKYRPTFVQLCSVIEMNIGKVSDSI